MSIESKLTEARAHLAMQRRQEAEGRAAAGERQRKAARRSWIDLLDFASRALGDDIASLLPRDPPEDFRGPDDSFSGWCGTSDYDWTLRLPGCGDILIRFDLHVTSSERRWKFRHGTNRAHDFVVPRYARRLDDDGPQVAYDRDDHLWHETDDFLVALALAEEEGAKKAELEAGLAEWAAPLLARREQERRERQRHERHPTVEERLLEALRRFVFESIPDPNYNP